jgi:hypothetical protein
MAFVSKSPVTFLLTPNFSKAEIACRVLVCFLISCSDGLDEDFEVTGGGAGLAGIDKLPITSEGFLLSEVFCEELVGLLMLIEDVWFDAVTAAL